VERKKPGRKRSQEPQKGIWMAVKDNAALVTVIGALLGVLITGAINTYIANKDQASQRELEAFNAEKQRELEQEKAQGAALQTYLDQMGQRLLNWDLHNAQEGSVLLASTRARTLAMFEQSSPEGKRIVLVFLNEADLIDANLVGAKLVGTQLSGADLSNAEGIDNEKLERQAKSLKMATMPNGQKYEDWLKDKE
jgi:uncharacterized protein YjbI with pentapeptide repeats